MTVTRRATYRVQLRAEFGFDQAADIVEYLSRLGISHLYTSPYLQAAPGSTHGYDVVDHTRVSDDLGGKAGHARMLAAIQRAGLGHIIDAVPNHMAISSHANSWWWDVLENGLASPYARYFDVDWDPPEARLRNTVLLPVLDNQYGRVLERGGIRLHREHGAFSIRYEDHRFPPDPRSLAPLLHRAADAVGSQRLAFIADTLDVLPRATDTDPTAVDRRHRDQRVAGEMLGELLDQDPSIGAALDAAVAAYNADQNLLHELLDQQNFRLAWWQSADRDLGYRRFFDVNTLIALSVENPRVFQDTHRLVLELVRSGAADGLRIDHPDGLQDPEGYLDRLNGTCPGCYVVVEKILAMDERLPRSWPVAGTTGYDFLNLVNGLFVAPGAEAQLTAFYADLTGVTDEYAAVAREKKLLVLREGLGSDVNRLAELLLRICEQHRRHRDYTRHMLTDAVRELLACFPVYRSYVRPANRQVAEEDRRWIDAATTEARRRRPDLDAELFEFLRAMLTLAVGGELEATFVRRFQQLSAAVMAKGVEDTAFYSYTRFVALNEVGGDPARFGVTPQEFHDRMAAMQSAYPDTMLGTATHDTKRGEDVRTRLAAISECPAQWMSAVREWCAHNEDYRTGSWPDRNTEYLYYQTLVGAWPLDVDRAVAYMEKASREAKVHTSWTAPHQEYDAALQQFVERTLGDDEFTASVARFVGTVRDAGRVNSLAQTLLKLTAPGIPDFYQGTELWSHDLVDPDNRRPVDYALRRRLLDAACQATAAEVLARADEGLPKLWLIRRGLAVRARRPGAFGREGAYRPLAAGGSAADRIVAFGRGADIVTVVPRLTRSANGWGDTTLSLPAGRWRNVLTEDQQEGTVRLAALLERFPVALLERDGA